MKYEIKQGDCLDLMKDITDKSIDMILCDLPYGTTKNKWDSIIPLSELWKQYERIIKDNGAIVLFAQVPFNVILGGSNVRLLKYEWIWQKDNSTGFLNSKKTPLKIHENILVFYKNQPTYNPQMRYGVGKCYKTVSGKKSSNYGDFKRVETKSNGERYPIDLIKFKRDRGFHPTQKPVKLLEYLIKTYTNENDIVLDNCMGSGSTGVACMNTNRKFIGFELDEKYFEIAKNRLEENYKQPKQMELF